MIARERLPVLLASLLVVALAIVGFAIGRSSRSDPAGADTARAQASIAAFKSSRDAARKAARAAGYRAGLAQGTRAGRLAGKRAGRKRVKRELATQAPAAPTTPASPYKTQGGKPAPNPGCPTGQEPTPGGGCAPYNEKNGQIEPKVDDPRCYKPDPPDKCF